jgi:iron complex transport system substrate-binding protein
MNLKSILLIPCFFLLFTTVVSATTVTDSEKKTLHFAKPFQRIISLYPAHTANLVELGLKKEIIACGPSDTLLPKLPRVQFQDDPERLLALKPDLVLIRPMVSRAYPNLVRTLEKNNVRVVSLQPTEIAELFTYWENLGKLTGREQQAKAMVETFGKRMAKITASLQQIPQEKRKRVYFEAIHKQMKTFASTSMAMFVLESAGGINIAADAERMRETNIAAYGKERILAKAAQIDFYLAQNGRMNPVSVDDIIKEPGFSVIKAVRTRQVFLVDEEMVSRPTMGLLDGIAFVRSLLYPDFDQEGASSL